MLADQTIAHTARRDEIAAAIAGFNRLTPGGPVPRPDVLVVDPPRAGLSKKIVRRVIECEAPRIVYVSCNPSVLKQDLCKFADAGYTVASVSPLDLFPHTSHVETVVQLQLSGA